MENKTALITGITGQDGSFLAELLLDKGYKIYGLVRRLSNPNIEYIGHLMDQIKLIDGDLSDQSSLFNAVKKSNPDEIYNLAAQSFVATSWNQAEFTANVTGIGALRVFEAARYVGNLYGKDIKVYQASSSEMFGNSPAPQNEDTRMVPRSPYGAAKVFAHNSARVYRESYDMFISCGILFNHESQRRGIEFVSRKISDGVAKIKLRKQKQLKLGNLEARRDWGYAKDYVKAMWSMLQQEKPNDFIIATGENHSVKDFVEIAFEYVGIDWQKHVELDKDFLRPAEIFELRGDCSKAEKILGWKPTTSFKKLVEIMVDNDLEKIKKSD